ncbi:MAG: tyrosine-type recombinase/integrase [Chloroflexi bacterium]|nr:tyrosine-type recombinase/integrase [Chloroflexota bacterium]
MNKIITTNQSNVIQLDQNPAAIYIASLASKSGQRTMMQVLNLMAWMLDEDKNMLSLEWGALRFQHVAAIRSRLSEKYKPATVNKALAALKGALRAAWQSGQMTAEDYQKAVSVKGVRGETLPSGRGMTSGELSALLSACEDDKTPAGARDAAIIAMMYSCGGLRRAEVVALDVADYDHESGCLKICGKGNKERTAYVTGGAERALSDWLGIRGNHSGALFVAVNKGGVLADGRLTSQTIYNMLQKRGDEAGVKSFSPHDLRRSFVSDLLDAGADITTVSKMAGHASVVTTSRYDRRPEEAKRKAASLLHVPYHGRG